MRVPDRLSATRTAIAKAILLSYPFLTVNSNETRAGKRCERNFGNENLVSNETRLKSAFSEPNKTRNLKIFNKVTVHRIVCFKWYPLLLQQISVSAVSFVRLQT